MSLLVKGANRFTQLADTPSVYTGLAGCMARVNATQDALEFGNAVTQYQVPTEIIPDNLGVVNSLHTGGYGKEYRIRIAGKYAITGGNGTGYIDIIDISNPRATVRVGHHNTGWEVYDLFVAGKYIYTIYSTGSSGYLLIYDWSNPASLSLVGQFTLAERSNYSIYVRGRYAYVIGYIGHRLQIIDISNPTQPVTVSNTTRSTNLTNPLDGIVVGNYAYIAASGYLSIWNVANPASPVYVNRVTTGRNGYARLKTWGNYVFLPDVNNKKLHIHNVANPGSPTLAGTLNFPGGTDSLFDIEVAGDWAFMTERRGLTDGYVHVIDCRDKSAPVIHESCYVTTPAKCIALAGKHVFVTAQYAGKFLSVQVWNLEIPTILGSVIWADKIYTYDLEVFNQLQGPSALIGGTGIPDTLPRMMSVPLVGCNVAAVAPGTSYVEFSALYRTNLDFTKISVKQARVIVSAIGNEAGAGKGIEVYDSSTPGGICAVTWDGNTQQNGLAGAWTNCNRRAATDIQVRIKASSATEDMTVDKVELQLYLN